MPRRIKKDSVERIIAEAKRREEHLNRNHPERHGYGFTEREADEFIRRLERLAHLEDRAQHSKIRDRTDRITVLASDKLYNESPEDIVIAKERTARIARAMVRNFRYGRNKERDQQLYDMYLGGLYTQQELADIFRINQSTVSRIIRNNSEGIRSFLNDGGEDHN